VQNDLSLGGGVNTKQAKDFLVEQAVEQAALDNVPLSDIEKRMMYFTESDSASCDNPIELNDEFEGQYETPAYESKIAQLIHRAYDRLKQEDPEKVRHWKESIRELRKGDHYFLVMWDMKPPAARSTWDSFKLWATGLLVVLALLTGPVLAAKYNINLDRFKRYLPVAMIILVVFVSGGFRLIYRLLFMWYHRQTSKGEPPL
jgi:hypothetical protein